jgi:hypothetical protein
MKTPRWFLVGLCLLALPAPAVHAATKAKKIEEIVLKENPTKKDVANYLDELEKIFSTTMAVPENVIFRDPPVPAGILDKLSKIPSTYVPQVVERAVSLARVGGHWQFRSALIESVKDRTDLDDAAKDAIFKGIPNHTILVTTVIRMDWIKGSEVKLLKLAKDSNQNGARRFIELVAKIDTPEARKLLPELMLRGHSMSMTESFKIAISQDLAWLEIEPLVLKAWKKIKTAEGREDLDDPLHFAPIAARFGETDALIMLAKKLNGAANQNLEKNLIVRQQLNEALLVLQQTIDTDVLETKSLVKLVLDNRDSLVFDKSIRKYRVPESSPPGSKALAR